MCLPVLGLVHLQYRPFLLDVPSPRRVLLRLFQSLFHIPIIVYHFVSSGSSPFSTALQPILLLTLSKYYCVAWHNLFLLALYTQTGGGSWFPYAPRITCICHIPLIFFHALVSIIFFFNANIDDVFLGSVLHFKQREFSSLYCFGMLLWSSFSVKLWCLFLLCPSFTTFFSFFHPSFHSV